MAEQAQEDKSFDTIADELLDKEESKTPSEASSENKQEDVKADGLTPGAEPEKTEQVKAVEADTSLSVEQKSAKIKELLGDDEKAIDAYIKQKGYHNDPAWQKQRELIEKFKKESQAQSLSKEDRLALDEFKKFRSSPEYIQTTMKSQGYTQEAIDKKLIESGFEVKTKPQDDVDLVTQRLGISLDEMNPTEKANVLANISDVSKIFNVLFEDKFGKVLPKELAPVKEHIETIRKTENSTKVISQMKGIVKNDGVLDFEKDIEPELNKFMDENPDCIQQDVLDHFTKINHSLTIERLKTGKKKEERNEMKSNLRQNIPISKSGTLPARTGNFEQDANAFFDAMNVPH